MTWTELENQRRVAKEPTTKSEIDELRALADRNLKDAALPQLSADGRFSMECASRTWRALNGSALIGDVIAGVEFADGAM